MICACRSHNELLRAAGCYRVTASWTGLSAGQNTRSLGQAKEPRARPMRAGDPLGDHSERAITLALIFEPVLTNQHGVSVPAPLAHQCRTGLQHDTGVEGRAAFLELFGQALQAAPQRCAGAAFSSLLQLMSKGSDHQIATETRRWSGAMQLPPGKPQIRRRPIDQPGNVACEFGAVRTTRSVVTIA